MEEHARLEASANRQADVENPDVQTEQSITPADSGTDGPIRGGAVEAADAGKAIDEEFAAGISTARINNAGSNPDGDARRSGGSPNDPDGGHELLGRERHAPDPDPIHELVPGGQGAEPPPYGADELTSRMAATARRQPGFGPSELDLPTLGRGNAEIGADPVTLAPAVDPTSAAARRREGIHETGGQAQAEAPPHGRRGSSDVDDAEQPAASLAYTAAQKPNLPPAGARDAEMPAAAQGSGMSEQPVERRDNTLVFDAARGNFELKEETHETGVSAQKHPS